MNHIALANHIRAIGYMAEIEGMTADNKKRESEGLSPMWTGDHFMVIKTSLDLLAQETLEWGWQE